jgi:cation:H+ antiporter
VPGAPRRCPYRSTPANTSREARDYYIDARRTSSVVSPVVLLPASFAILLAGALLFTNAIEWFGSMLNLGQGAVGSILAAVATALPESLIPVVAIIGGERGSKDVAVGAILGAPLLLATIAMALVGVAALLYRGRRPQGLSLSVHPPTLERDLAFFIGCLVVALGVGLGAPQALQIVAAAVLIAAYVLYVAWTLRHSGPVESEEALKPLIMDTTRGDPPGMLTVIVHLFVALAAIAGGAHLFVEQILHVAGSVGLQPLVLSLVLAPFATELPEKANSSSGFATARTRSRSGTSPERWCSSRRSPCRSGCCSPAGSSTRTRSSRDVSRSPVASSRS